MKFHKSMRIHQKELENSEKLYLKKNNCESNHNNFKT